MKGPGLGLGNQSFTFACSHTIPAYITTMFDIEYGYNDLDSVNQQQSSREQRLATRNKHIHDRLSLPPISRNCTHAHTSKHVTGRSADPEDIHQCAGLHALSETINTLFNHQTDSPLHMDGGIFGTSLLSRKCKFGIDLRQGEGFQCRDRDDEAGAREGRTNIHMRRDAGEDLHGMR